MTITAPQGFRAAGVKAGIKASGNPDLALVVNDGPLKAAAAVFTSNRVAAAPVHWSRQVLSDGRVDAVVLNSGGANACTGPLGFQNTHATAEKVAAVLGISASDVVVCSTGLIGEQLPMDKIIPGIEAAFAELSENGGPAAEQLGAGITQVCAELARKLIGDAEGASHDIAIRTFNAASERDAEIVSRSVARSNLFKTAIFGKDPNWGRVLSSVGTTDAVFEPDQLNVSMNGIQICRNGSIGDDRNLVDLEPREVLVEIDLQAGDAEATIWTNDLTHEYVHENSAYSS